MMRLMRKNIQVVEEFATELGKMEHGRQQEAVNAALGMFFLASVNQKRYFVRLFREMRDGHFKMKPRESGHSALLYSVSEEEGEKEVALTDRMFPGPAQYFDEGEVSELPEDLKKEKYPAHLRTGSADKGEGEGKRARPRVGKSEPASAEAVRSAEELDQKGKRTSQKRGARRSKDRSA
jgi:hypothetical protein